MHPNNMLNNKKDILHTLVNNLDDKETHIMLYSYAKEKMKSLMQEINKVEGKMSVIRSDYFNGTIQSKANIAQLTQFKTQYPYTSHMVEKEIDQLRNQLQSLHGQLAHIETFLHKIQR
jgi:acylphosphatase